MVNEAVLKRLLKKAGIEEGIVTLDEYDYEEDDNYMLVSVDEKDERVWAFKIKSNRIYNFEQII